MQEQKDLSDKANIEDRKEETKQQQIKAEAAQPRPFYGFLEISLMYPKILVSGSRKNYQADVTTHVTAMGRIFSSQDAQSVQPWVGLRVAPFGGFGTQKGHRGRFALTYIGPAIGFGRISSQDVSEVDKEAPPERSGWLISTGAAAVYRTTRQDEPETSHATDFQNSGWASDAPGVWLEGRYIHIAMGAVGIHGVIGVQTAQGKTFAYLGAAIAGYL